MSVHAAVALFGVLLVCQAGISLRLNILLGRVEKRVKDLEIIVKHQVLTKLTDKA